MESINRGMTFHDHLFMHPVEKFEVYGKFPWKLVVSILLLILTSAQVLLLTMPDGQYSYNQLILWNKLFLNGRATGDDYDIVDEYHFYTIEEMRKFVEKTTFVRNI